MRKIFDKTAKVFLTVQSIAVLGLAGGLVIAAMVFLSVRETLKNGSKK